MNWQLEAANVKVDDSFKPSLEDETIGVQNLLAKPKIDHVSVDDALCFDWEYHITFGNVEVLDGLLDEVHEVDDIHEADDFYGAYEDFLLESSTATVPASKSKNGPLQKTVKCKLFCSSGDKCDSREPAEDGVWLISDDLEDLDELDDDAKPLISLLSGKNAKKVVQAAKVGT
ncbi:hypothetical protein SADUNF_Sadunf16G0081200 [Salix dunnii]|uniref:Uncharacterized protein n=1 Tax=Salix dunnii TaxID=1413687 RepID=A0A835MGC6_9ROSI|nr:hypothetical protein SADUNF_Sadunf16G0081200 [Salix dunnii]